MTNDPFEYKKLRWEIELSDPEPTSPIYLSASALKTLKYYLGHLTAGEEVDEDLTLSEAITKLGNEWNRLSNAEITCRRKHKPLDKLIKATWAHKHRKCKPEGCARKDFDRCPHWEY